MAWAGLRPFTWLATALVAAVGVVVGPSSVAAQPADQITPLGPDTGRGVDRYQMVVGPGGSFWELGVSHLPLLALEQGDLKAVTLIEQAWRAQYPGRTPNDVRPDDSFVLEVPNGTFVARSQVRQSDRLIFDSFGGDQLTTFPRDPVIAYRLRRAGLEGRAEVLINGGQASAVEEARRIYDVDSPDFLQVRTVRGALQERTTKITLDLTKKYLDDFRNYRDRAARVERTPDGLTAYAFDRTDQDNPLVRVEDAIGDETDPGNFPRLCRIAFYRDGTVRRYLITESGDSLATLSRPDNAAWTKVLPSWQEWLPGQAEALPPFTPAISSAGVLLPGRILVIAYRPRSSQASPQPTRTAAGGSSLDCLGVPLGLLLVAGLAFGMRRSVASD